MLMLMLMLIKPGVRYVGAYCHPLGGNFYFEKYSRNNVFLFSLLLLLALRGVFAVISEILCSWGTRLLYNERGRNKEICVHYPREGDTPSLPPPHPHKLPFFFTCFHHNFSGKQPTSKLIHSYIIYACRSQAD